MKILLEKKIKSHLGLSHIEFFICVIAILLILSITIHVAQNIANSKMNDVDEEQIVYAEHQASIEYQKNYKAFTAVFDTETKRFVDKRTARMSVKPYGSSKEHQGMYLLITVDKDGNISSQWISP